MVLGGLRAGKALSSLRSSNALSSVGSTVKSGLSGIKSTAVGGGILGYAGANVEQTVTDATGADDGVGASMTRLSYALGALAVVFVFGQLFDIQIGG